MTTPPLTSARIAFTTLTALPFRAPWSPEAARDAVGYYPFVGLVLGGVAFGLDELLVRLGALRAGPLALAVLTVGLWAGLTRALHWDGLADVADGYFADSTEDRLRIMHDSSVGAFGMTAVALVLLLQVSTLATLIGRGTLVLLVVVPVFGRLAAAFGAWFGTPARTQGLGASITGAPRIGSVVVASATVLLCAGMLVWLRPAAGACTALAGIALAAVVPHLVSRRFGGVTGDVLGASVLIVEAATALVAAWVW